MRKTLLIVISFLLVFCSSNATAFAQEDYPWVRVTQKGVILYANEDCTKQIIELPISYYLQIISQTQQVYFVSILDDTTTGFSPICGYVYASQVEKCTTTPIAPTYPQVLLAVCCDSAQIKLLPSATSQTLVTATNTQVVYYYGSITQEDTLWHYVSYANKFGYVSANCLTPPQIPLHTTPLAVNKPNVDTACAIDDVATTGKQHPTAEILLIVFVVILFGGLTLTMFLPGNTKKTQVFDYDI